MSETHDPQRRRFLKAAGAAAASTAFPPTFHVHACFDRDGNIYVVEWVTTGRISFLRQVA